MRWRLFAACAIAYAVALLALLPATLADAGLSSASAGQLRMSEAHGTLWSGAGTIEVRDARGRTGFGMRLAWRLRPAALLRARLAYDLAFDAASRPFLASLSWSGLDLEDAALNLPAAALGLALPTLAPLGLLGDLQLRVPRLSFARGAAHGSATLQWLIAGSALSPVSPLGDYELRLEADGLAIHATLQTLRGPLQLDGQGGWTRGAKPVFRATARMPADVRPRLTPFLRLIGVEHGDGSFDLRINTILPQSPQATRPVRAMYASEQ